MAFSRLKTSFNNELRWWICPFSYNTWIWGYWTQRNGNSPLNIKSCALFCFQTEHLPSKIFFGLINLTSVDKARGRKCEKSFAVCTCVKVRRNISSVCACLLHHMDKILDTTQITEKSQTSSWSVLGSFSSWRIWTTLRGTVQTWTAVTDLLFGHGRMFCLMFPRKNELQK